MDTATYRRFLVRAAALLDEHAGTLDVLNVFPVPDADTGTNLARTAAAVVDAIRDVPDPEVAATASRAALWGAQGNAGTILSQVLAGLAEGTDATGRLDPGRLAPALDRARELAYAAVHEPVEGTMLTAVRVAAETAAAVDDDVTGAVADAVSRAVGATVDQLPQLTRAGVVDAGAFGFEIVCRALHATVTGADPAIPSRPPRAGAHPPRSAAVAGPRFEVQYRVRGGASDRDGLRDRLGAIGESVGVVQVDDVLHVHVHAGDTAAVLAVGRQVGEVSGVQVTDLHAQVRDRHG